MQYSFLFVDNPQAIAPIRKDLPIKIPNEGIPAAVHQDLALQSVGGDVFSLAVSLYSFHPNPVYYLSKSHHLSYPVGDEIYKAYHKRKKEFIPLKVNAGDIIAHTARRFIILIKTSSPIRAILGILSFAHLTNSLMIVPGVVSGLTGVRQSGAVLQRDYRSPDPRL